MIDWQEYERLEPHIVAALQYNGGEQTLDDVKSGLASGQFQFWPGRDSVIVTEYTETPHLKILNFFLAGGDMDELQTMAKHIESAAREVGINRMTVYGRRGWERTFLKGMDYRPKWVVLVKEL
jgi:hypothetical protein